MQGKGVVAAAGWTEVEGSSRWPWPIRWTAGQTKVEGTFQPVAVAHPLSGTFLLSMHSGGSDTAVARYSAVGTQVGVLAQEETSKDDEVRHKPEVIGYLATTP
eukprot:Sspe_Gene.38193::Locus_18414_Transcript_4_7_Confidence_0.391_Length_628::g.38193::m.38193